MCSCLRDVEPHKSVEAFFAGRFAYVHPACARRWLRLDPYVPQVLRIALPQATEAELADAVDRHDQFLQVLRTALAELRRSIEHRPRRIR